MAPGCELPVHYHTGSAQVWTIQGRWEYKEYPPSRRWRAPTMQARRLGAHLLLPGGQHRGHHRPGLDRGRAQVSFNEDGTFHSINDAVSVQYLTDTAAAAQGTGPVPYIHGGAAGVNRS